MSDTWANGGIIVYDYTKSLARRWDDTSLHGNSSNQITINGISYAIVNPSDGIALSHDGLMLYYCALGRPFLFGVPTRYLQDFSVPDRIISNQVIEYGRKGYSDGLAYSNNEYLYIASMEESAIYRWNHTIPISTMELVVQDTTTMQWGDTFAFDGKKNLLFVANKLQKFFFGEMAFDGSDGYNFRIWSVAINGDSYLSGKPIPPVSPCDL